MTPEDRIAELERQMAKLMAIVGIHSQPMTSKKKQQQERIQIRKQILKIK